MDDKEYEQLQIKNFALNQACAYHIEKAGKKGIRIKTEKELKDLFLNLESTMELSKKIKEMMIETFSQR